MGGSRIRGGCAVAVCALALAYLASASSAAASTSWKPLVTSGQLGPADLIGTARGPDGILHVAWLRREPDGLFDLMQSLIAPVSGAIPPATPIVTGWESIKGPTLLVSGGELLAFFSGIRTLDPLDPFTGLDYAIGLDDGASWEAPTLVTPDPYGNDTSATLGPDGALTAWPNFDGTVTHLGTDPTLPVEGGFAGGSDGGQAIATSGERALVAWCTDLESPDGVFVQPVDPATAGPAGSAELVPGSTSQGRAYCPATTRVPLVARQNKGFFVATVNGSQDTVRGWRVGASRSMTLAQGPKVKQYVAAAASPGKKASVWVAWDVNDQTVQLRRSNPDATVFGATVTLNVPRNGTLSGLDLNAQQDRVDLIARVQRRGGYELEHAQSGPGLTLIAHGGTRASFRVLDAGDPVSGATVTIAGHTATTGHDGRVQLGIDRAGRYTAHVTAHGYVGATATLRINSS